MKAKKIKPFTFLDANQCPKCGSKMMLVEDETYVAALDKKGLPIGGQSFIDQKLICKTCGESYTAEKKGMCFQIKSSLPPIPVIVQDYNPFYQ